MDYRSPTLQGPHRKPLPTGNAGLQFQFSDSAQSQQSLPLRERGSPVNQHRPRTASSSFLPTSMHPLRQTTVVYPPQQQYNVAPPSRRASNATISTTSTGGTPSNYANPSQSQSGGVRRSSSSRTVNSSQVGYVALMRRQKATVWCDRSQNEDAREAHQRRVAKQRAVREVQGGGGSTRTNTLASSGKIRHSSAIKPLLSTGTMVGAAVPLRLSANEVGNADDDYDNGDGTTTHRRTNSGRSSTSSRRLGYRLNQGRLSTSSTPPALEPTDLRTDIPDILEIPVAESGDALKTPIAARDNQGGDAQFDSSDRPITSHSTVSQHEENFGKITEMKAPSGATSAVRRQNVNEELKRRGSVDDRTSTMTGVRLFVANPDLSD